MAILFTTEDIDFNLKEKSRIRKWIEVVILEHGKEPGDINFIFVSNEYLLSMNKNYLNHNYFTDVITFDYVDGDVISGDIFVSIDQVRSNSEIFHTGLNMELLRVMIHGVLHLIGFDDKSEELAKIMRSEEDQALELYMKV